jgi:hypothetical protein
MASRFPRRRRDRSESEPPTEPDEDVRLDGDEHAWWAQRDIDEAWTPREPPPPPEDPEKARDVLAEHFGADWRTSFGFEPARVDGPADGAASGPAAEPVDEAPELDEPTDGSDPYAVLGVDQGASWEEIVEAHRRMARRHHPDRLVGRAPAEIEAGEDRIRVINIAYQELRVRRGR